MAAMRGVTLTVGKGVYTVNTVLSDEEVDRVREVLSGISGEYEGKGVRQEDVLVLVCLRLAYEDVRVEGILRGMLRGIEGVS